MNSSNPKYRTLTDEEMMQLFIYKKEVTAYNEIYSRYYPLLCKYGTWQCGNSATAKDITQEVLYKLWKDPEAFDINRNLKTWLYTTMSNAIKNEYRSINSRTNIAEKYSNISTDNSTPNEQNTQKIKQVSNAISTLSDNHREVFVLKYSNNLTIPEISQALSISEGTVKSRLFYALKQLRKQVLTNQNLKK